MNILLAQFRDEICKAGKLTEDEDLDWYSLSVGFFLARGVTVDEAFNLACSARYTFQYWQAS